MNPRASYQFNQSYSSSALHSIMEQGAFRGLTMSLKF